MNYPQTIRCLNKLTYSQGIKPGLKRIQLLLKKLGNPEKYLRTIHIAGTNGKGTVTRLLAAAFQNSGYLTAEYSSPHLISYRERFLINGEMISKKDLAQFFSKVIKLSRKIKGLTEFEILTGIAFEYFKQKKAEIVILETGLGGRFDATNIVNPLAAIITSVSYDHQVYLGSSLKKIAAEKAGIIKKNIPVIIGQLPKIAQNIIKKQAKILKTKVIQASPLKIKTKMQGTQQAINTGLALEVFKLFKNKLTLNKKQFIKGIQQAYLPGRFQVIKQKNKPLLILDGAHNQEASALLVKNLKIYYPKKKKTFIIGILKRKDSQIILKNIASIADQIILTAPGEEYHSIKELQKYSPNNKLAFASLKQAYKNANKITSKKDLICITGSFYLVGEFLKEFL
ncbi:MAG: bifunctional folylpolyglutamate synthase/dihydrofolate synthase [Candidatus Margulisbacteria bacterium]|nr:bifunctional folylpolyglutamate synthase/dihydrofolate synthase [Candidatus Margulisiibacteriota bacterium]